MCPAHGVGARMDEKLWAAGQAWWAGGDSAQRHNRGRGHWASAWAERVPSGQPGHRHAAPGTVNFQGKSAHLG